MNFRNAKRKDAKTLDRLLTLLIEDEKNYDNKVESVIVKDFYINYINDPSKYFYLCEDNNKVVAYIYSKKENSNLKIDALYVLQDYRNKGIASKLIDNVISYAKENNFKTISINVLEKNIKAKNLYCKYFKLYKKDGIKEELRMEI